MHIIFGITHLFKEQFAGKDGLSFQILENHSVNRTLVGSELTINNVVRLAMEKKIAEKFGVTQAAYQKWELGECRMPDP